MSTRHHLIDGTFPQISRGRRCRRPRAAAVCAETGQDGDPRRLLARAEVPPHQRVQVRDPIVLDDGLAYETTPTLTADPQLAQISETHLVLTDLWEVAFDPKVVT